jgi:3-oxoacyl-(acyl-carrier-protein) synthase
LYQTIVIIYEKAFDGTSYFRETRLIIMKDQKLRRVVITGLGVIAPNGIGKDEFWQACISGRSGVRRITRFDASFLPTQIAGEIAAFDPEASGLTSEESSILDRGTQFAVAAANLAFRDSGLPDELSESERNAMGVYMATAMAFVEEAEKLVLQLTDQTTSSPGKLTPDIHPSTLFTSFSSASAIAAHFQLYGPCTVLSTGCSAGADAIGHAFWAIQEGRADRMLAGGSDSAITPLGINVFSVMKALSTRNDEPERASRPYDGQRDGFVTAEGAGVLLLEERDLALARSAHIYAELIAFSSNSNGHHMTTLPEDGVPLQYLLKQVVEEAHITPVQLGYINSHGSSTPTNEVAETAAYKAAFGEHAYHIPISATKSMIGHTQGAASAIEVIVTALVLDRHLIPPTINQERPGPNCDLDYVPNVARHARVDVALTHSSGFGGVNTALVLARPDWMYR